MQKKKRLVIQYHCYKCSKYAFTWKTQLPDSSVGIQSMHQADRKLTDAVSATTGAKRFPKHEDDQNVR